MISSKNNSGSKKILIIDDDPSILEAIRLILEDEGYSIDTLTSGENICEKVITLQPKMILLDIWLPKYDGKDITRKLKKDTKTKDIPVILMSANQDIKKVANEVKADNILAKPFEIDELMSLVGKYCS